MFVWWRDSSTFDAMSGRAVGPPEWPRPGGLSRQQAWLVEAVGLIRREWDAMLACKNAGKDAKADGQGARG